MREKQFIDLSSISFMKSHAKILLSLLFSAFLKKVQKYTKKLKSTPLVNHL